MLYSTRYDASESEDLLSNRKPCHVEVSEARDISWTKLISASKPYVYNHQQMTALRDTVTVSKPPSLRPQPPSLRRGVHDDVVVHHGRAVRQRRELRRIAEQAGVAREHEALARRLRGRHLLAPDGRGPLGRVVGAARRPIVGAPAVAALRASVRSVCRTAGVDGPRRDVLACDGAGEDAEECFGLVGHDWIRTTKPKRRAMSALSLLLGLGARTGWGKRGWFLPACPAWKTREKE